MFCLLKFQQRQFDSGLFYEFHICLLLPIRHSCQSYKDPHLTSSNYKINVLTQDIPGNGKADDPAKVGGNTRNLIQLRDLKRWDYGQGLRVKWGITFLALGWLHKRSSLRCQTRNLTVISFLEKHFATVQELNSTSEDSMNDGSHPAVLLHT